MIPTQIQPEYKPCIRLRLNLKGNLYLKLARGKFLKRKWRISGLRRRPKIYTNHKLCLTKFPNSLHSRYRQDLYSRQRLKLFYGQIQDRRLQNIVRQKPLHWTHMVQRLEQRLDVVLYRWNLVNSLSEARFWIRQKRVLVNQRATSVYQNLKKGDVICFDNYLQNLIRERWIQLSQKRRYRKFAKTRQSKSRKPRNFDFLRRYGNWVEFDSESFSLTLVASADKPVYPFPGGIQQIWSFYRI